MVRVSIIKMLIQKKKLQAMCDKLGFKVIKLKDYRWKKDRDYMINLIAKKL